MSLSIRLCLLPERYNLNEYFGTYLHIFGRGWHLYILVAKLMALLLQGHSRLNLCWGEEHRTGVRLEIRGNIGTAVTKVRGPFKKVIS